MHLFDVWLCVESVMIRSFIDNGVINPFESCVPLLYWPIHISGVVDVLMNWVLIRNDCSPAPDCYLNHATRIYMFTPEIVGDGFMSLFFLN